MKKAIKATVNLLAIYLVFSLFVAFLLKFIFHLNITKIDLATIFIVAFVGCVTYFAGYIRALKDKDI